MKVKGILRQPTVEQFPGDRFMICISDISDIPISCVLSLHSFSFASISFFAESIDLGGHSGLGRQKELMRRNVLGRRQSNTGK